MVRWLVEGGILLGMWCNGGVVLGEGWLDCDEVVMLQWCGVGASIPRHDSVRVDTLHHGYRKYDVYS